MFKTFYRKVDKNFHVKFSSVLFVLTRSRVFLSDDISKPAQKLFARNPRQKFLQKNGGKSKTDFFSISSITFLGVSRRGEFETTIKNTTGQIFDPVTFMASDLSTYHRDP
jgi:hypothetical protein